MLSHTFSSLQRTQRPSNRAADKLRHGEGVDAYAPLAEDARSWGMGLRRHAAAHWLPENGVLCSAAAASPSMHAMPCKLRRVRELRGFAHGGGLLAHPRSAEPALHADSARGFSSWLPQVSSALRSLKQRQPRRWLLPCLARRCH